MRFRFSKLNASLLCAATVLAMGSSLEGQQGGVQPAGPIIFSAGDATSAEPTAAGTDPKRRTIVDPIQVPSSDFNMSRPASSMPAPTIRPPVKSDRDDAKNWVFMTPSEILGVSTPEKMMGIPERSEERRVGKEC